MINTENSCMWASFATPGSDDVRVPPLQVRRTTTGCGRSATLRPTSSWCASLSCRPLPLRTWGRRWVQSASCSRGTSLEPKCCSFFLPLCSCEGHKLSFSPVGIAASQICCPAFVRSLTLDFSFFSGCSGCQRFLTTVHGRLSCWSGLRWTWEMTATLWRNWPRINREPCRVRAEINWLGSSGLSNTWSVPLSRRYRGFF